jgi:hypothetical protein
VVRALYPVTPHCMSVTRIQHDDGAEEKNDGFDESDSAAPEESVEPVAIVEPTFQTATNPGKKRRCS